MFYKNVIYNVLIIRKVVLLVGCKGLAEIRKKKGMTQEELAQLLSITTVTLSRWENGHFEPKASVIRQLCEVLDCTEAELLNGPDDGKIKITLEYDWGKMKEGKINMEDNGFELILGSNGKVGLHGAGMITSRDAIEDFLAKVREQLEIALEAQVRRGVVQG